MAKAKKVETYRDKYFTQIVYEYRGVRYEVEYANGHNVCCTPAWIQHRDAQAEIDDMLDNPKPEMPSEPGMSVQDSIDWFFEQVDA